MEGKSSPLGIMTIIVGLVVIVSLVISIAASNHVIIFQGSSVDLSAVLLTAATLVVTGVGVTVGIVAVWGFREIKDRAIAAAIEAAKTEAHMVAEATAKDAAAPMAARTASEAVAPALERIDAALNALQQAQGQGDHLVIDGGDYGEAQETDDD